MILLFKQWLYCVKHYTLMCVFASGPERLPHRVDCIFLTMFSYCLLGFALVNEQRNYGTVFLQILLELLLLALVVYLGLKWRQKLTRFWQSFSALVGVNFIISAVMTPIFYWLAPELNTETEITSELLYATMIMVFWNLAVLSQIFRRAFEINTLLSAMIAFNYFLVYQFIVAWFY